jgi:predicted enzyme related to lactoylglutathione lyase
MKNLFIHVELNTVDLGKAKKFYKGLFSWKMQDVKMEDGMTYTMLDTGSKEAGGGMQLKQMPDMPTSWVPYVEVDDVKKTVAKAQKLGACIDVAYQPLEGMGALGIFTDPTGATLGVWEREKKKAKKPAKKKSRR